jgi:hypothetical protein
MKNYHGCVFLACATECPGFVGSGKIFRRRGSSTGQDSRLILPFISTPLTGEGSGIYAMPWKGATIKRKYKRSVAETSLTVNGSYTWSMPGRIGSIAFRIGLPSKAKSICAPHRKEAKALSCCRGMRLDLPHL